MKVKTQIKCPDCGSKEILTLGLDQMCCDCDWDNSSLLVELGQMDNLKQAYRQHFEANPIKILPKEVQI